MACNHRESGKVIAYTNAGAEAVASGSALVIGAILGVAVVTIAPGETGSVAISEVFDLPKAAEAVAQGAALYWDADGTPAGGTAGAGCLTAAAAEGNVAAGVAVAAAASADATVPCKLNV